MKPATHRGATTRVLVVDDASGDLLVMSTTLSSIAGMEVAGLVASVGAAQRRLERGGVDVVMLAVAFRFLPPTPLHEKTNGV